ncbi:MAG: tetratricopeptide repeat protein [Spartobacteria bacterium]|nr:tetratricopeptide repeat protein [Spartobacteria bacterium]
MKLIPTAMVVLLAVGFCGCAGVKQDKDAATLLKEGWESYQLGEFKLAIRLFEQAREITPENDPLYPDILYGLATTWNLRRPNQDPALAEGYYNRLLELAPESELAAWTMLGLARMKHLVPVGEDPDYEQVRQGYYNVIETYPDHLAADEAFLYLQASYVQDLEKTSAQKVVDQVTKFIEQNPDSKFISPCYSILSTCYEVLDEPEKRLDAELKAHETAEVDPTNPFQDNSWRYWMLATLAEFESGDFDTARLYYQKLLDEYPQDIRVYSVTLALERMDRIEEQIRQELKQGS